MTGRSRRSKGFTLIELLVVIAIIAILAAMLFPVFARARESARKIQCLSNVKNIAMAVQMYLTDYDRFWPTEHNTQFLQQVADIAGRASCGLKERLNPYLREQVVLDEYIRNREVWNCPSAKWINSPGTIVSATPGPTIYDWWLTNGGFVGFGYSGTRDDPGDNGYKACENVFPSGWGGDVTDSYIQQKSASLRLDRSSDPRGNTFVFTYACTGPLRDMKTSQMEDASRYVVVGDSSQAERLFTTAQIAFPELCIVISHCGWCNGCYGACGPDLAECPWADKCTIDKTQFYRFWTDTEFRKQYTRHLGGSNIGFADGHAAWMPAEAIINNSAPVSQDPSLLGLTSYLPYCPPPTGPPSS